MFGRLKEDMDNTKGIFGLYIYDFRNSKTYTHNEDTEFYAASIFKIYLVNSVIIHIETGKLSLEDKYTHKEGDKADGTGTL